MTSDATHFTCNLCGAHSALGDDPRHICEGCRSTERMRLVVHAFTRGVLGVDAPFSQLQGPLKLRGIGLSDWVGYADRLAKLCDYTNTFYHCEPRVDITAPPQNQIGRNDFLISSDVFEHVPPPVLSAFRGAFQVLKPGGKFLLTVPMNRRFTQTIEHYPKLHDFSVEKRGEDWVVVNTLAEGGTETYLHPRFHGGPGQTLEMRIFSETHVRELLQQAGFVDIRIFEGPLPEYGLIGAQALNGAVVATRPQA
ncbi:methyltransferase domain-containing protein [Lysobacter sp. 2RAF19]